MAEIRLGTSGWSYGDWEGVFYKPGESKFQKYSKVFDTVEIDSTFYSYPSPEVVEGLVKAAPEGFVFAAKIPSLITHNKKLDVDKAVEKDLKRFLDLMEPLRKAGKLGPLLIQLPPKFVYQDRFDSFKQFLEVLPSDFMFAVEFRDESWLRDDVFKELERHEVAYTIVDEPLLPPDLYVTADFAYIRWHGRGRNPWYYYHYRREELEEWKPRIEELKTKVKTIYGYFNNHFHGYAVHNCLQVLEILGIITPRQRKVLEEVEKAFEQPHKVSLTLSELLPPQKLPEEVDQLLRLLTDERRFKRAMGIDSDLIKIEEKTDQYVHAKVKDYTVIIDLEKKLIIHDCADWSRVGLRLNFCKHVAALMLHLDKEYAKKILKDILMNRIQWTFREA